MQGNDQAVRNGVARLTGEVGQQVDSDQNQRKGEFVLVVAGCQPDRMGLAGALELARTLQEYLSASQAARVAARVHGVSRRELYAELEQSG